MLTRVRHDHEWWQAVTAQVVWRGIGRVHARSGGKCKLARRSGPLISVDRQSNASGAKRGNDGSDTLPASKARE